QGREIPDLGRPRGHRVIPELVEIRIDVRIDRGPAAPEMQHARRGDADLRRPVRPLLQKREGIGKDACRPPQLPHHAADETGELFDRRVVLKWKSRGDRLSMLYPRDASAGESQQKILKPRSTAKFTVGDDLEPDVFLQLHDVRDGGVLELSQLFELQRSADLTILIALGLGARLQQPGRPQQAADVLGAKWWCAHKTVKSYLRTQNSSPMRTRRTPRH